MQFTHLEDLLRLLRSAFFDILTFTIATQAHAWHNAAFHQGQDVLAFAGLQNATSDVHVCAIKRDFFPFGHSLQQVRTPALVRRMFSFTENLNRSSLSCA